MSWQGRVAVVTGIARPAGIGQACAKLLFKQGFSIVGIDREAPTFAVNVPWINRGTAIEEAPPAADTAAAAEATPKVAWIMCDLSQQDQILSLPSQLDDLGVSAVNVLVNNAGIADPYMQSDTISERAKLWSKYIAVNLSAPFLLSEGYGAAKAGLLGLTHAQAASLSPHGIRVNAICPGWIDTTGEAAAASSITQEQHQWHWTGKVGTPSDIAELVAFLADGSKSGFITGQHFVVDGGVTKKMVYPE